jgi:hypothetical protein
LGSEAAELLVVTSTWIPPVGAGPVRVTVAVATVLVVLEVLNLTDARLGERSTKVARALLPCIDAVIVMGISSTTGAVVIGKVALLAPAGIDTLAGVDARELLLDNVTVVPDGGATLFSVTTPMALFGAVT